MNIIYKTRTLLIQIGKVLPFVICFIVLVSYLESLFALTTNDFLYYNGSYVLNKPISWFIGNFFEYNVQTWIVLCVISISIETCMFNKLACVYLGVNLYEKSYFIQVEWETEYYYIVIVLNVLIATFFVYKGISILLKKH